MCAWLWILLRIAYQAIISNEERNISTKEEFVSYKIAKPLGFKKVCACNDFLLLELTDGFQKWG